MSTEGWVRFWAKVAVSARGVSTRGETYREVVRLALPWAREGSASPFTAVEWACMYEIDQKRKKTS